MKIFDSKYPILEACMNKGSTLPLALAVYDAGAYPSFCSWTYDGNFEQMESDIKTFIDETGSNKIHVSFQPDHLKSVSICHDIMFKYELPTIELIFGKGDVLRPLDSYKREKEEFEQTISLIKPLHDKGVKIFRRLSRVTTQEEIDKYYIDGVCLKGNEASGYTGKWTIETLWQGQKKLTPNTMLIPYGGVSTPELVKKYLNDGAEVIAVGSKFAFSKESPISKKAKEKVIKSSSEDIVSYPHDYGFSKKHQNAIEFSTVYKHNEKYDFNRTNNLMSGLYSNNDIGHVFIGKSVDYINKISTCKEIVFDLMKEYSDET